MTLRLDFAIPYGLRRINDPSRLAPLLNVSLQSSSAIMELIYFAKHLHFQETCRDSSTIFIVALHFIIQQHGCGQIVHNMI